MTGTLQEDLTAFDIDQRRALIETHEAHPDWEWGKIEAEVKDKTRNRFLTIVNIHNEGYCTPPQAIHRESSQEADQSEKDI